MTDHRDHYAIPGAGRAFNPNARPPIEKLDRPTLPRWEVQAILEAGKRNFIDGAQALADRRAYLSLVREAFIEGVLNGSSGFVDRGMAMKEWQHADTAKQLRGNPPGVDVVRWRVISTDPRAAGRESWVLLALDDDQAWLKSEGVYLTVPADTCRMMVPRDMRSLAEITR